MPRPRACVESTVNGRPSIHRARRTSPAATSARIAELETSRPAHAHRPMQAHREAQLRSHRGQFFHARRRSVPEAEVLPLVHGPHSERADKNLFDELSRRETRQRLVEFQHQCRVDSRLRQQAQPFRSRRNQPRRFVGTQKLLRVRIERHRDSLRSRGTRVGYHASENLPVPAMHAVKISHRGHRRPESRGNLRERMKDAPRISSGPRPAAHSLTGTLNPS